MQGAARYSTLRPCFGCLKELYQSGVSAVRYLNEWTPSDPVEAAAYDSLLGELAGRGVVVAPLDGDSIFVGVFPRHDGLGS